MGGKSGHFLTENRRMFEDDENPWNKLYKFSMQKLPFHLTFILATCQKWQILWKLTVLWTPSVNYTALITQKFCSLIHKTKIILYFTNNCMFTLFVKLLELVAFKKYSNLAARHYFKSKWYSVHYILPGKV